MKTGEVIDILNQANSECVFVNEEGGRIRRFACNIVWAINNITVKLTDKFLSHTWELVRQPVDFMTAVNSGKRIRPDDEPAKIHGFNELGYWSLNIDRINGRWLVE